MGPPRVAPNLSATPEAPAECSLPMIPEKLAASKLQSAPVFGH